MNSNLYNKKVTIPENIKKYLEKCFAAAKGASETTEGYKRNKQLRESSDISYQQLKRIKNWFDNYEGTNKDLSFVLNGGDYVKKWVDTTLNQMRNMTKNNSSDLVPEKITNPSSDFKITNIQNMNRPSASHKKTIQKYDTAVTETLKELNKLFNIL